MNKKFSPSAKISSHRNFTRFRFYVKTLPEQIILIIENIVGRTPEVNRNVGTSPNKTNISKIIGDCSELGFRKNQKRMPPALD